MDNNLDNNLDVDTEVNTEINEETPNQKGGCGCGAVVAILVVLALIIGIPVYNTIKEDREREAKYAYESSLPKALDLGKTVDDLTRDAQIHVGKRIEFTLGDFLSSTYSIDKIKCTSVRQFGVRNDTVVIEYKAYSLYFDGQISFSKTERLKYNFDKNQWINDTGYKSEWTPDNVTINN